MSLHLHYHLYQLMVTNLLLLFRSTNYLLSHHLFCVALILVKFEQSKGEDEPEDRYGVEEQRGVWRKKGEAVRSITTAE